MDLDSPWADEQDHHIAQENEWLKISSGFINAGYREGITAGKESALQEGFDAGFAQVGAPLGQELGILRGIASALISLLSSASLPPPCQSPMSSPGMTLAEARDIAAELANVRYTDIAPPDLEAEAHAREHLQDGDDGRADAGLPEELMEKRRVEKLEDMLANMATGDEKAGTRRPTADEVRNLGERLYALCTAVGINLAGLDDRKS
ncbi:hypothetical protein AX17_005476 [Amanita inopinata Kibby_2008]|nr:hypothetical protein AX17_005476 [Amanita inopinata Kibby_2008]